MVGKLVFLKTDIGYHWIICDDAGLEKGKETDYKNGDTLGKDFGVEKDKKMHSKDETKVEKRLVETIKTEIIPVTASIMIIIMTIVDDSENNGNNHCDGNNDKN